MDLLLSATVGLFVYSYLKDIDIRSKLVNSINKLGGAYNDAKIYPEGFETTECNKILELYDMMFEDGLLEMAEAKNIIDIYIEILKLNTALVSKLEPCDKVLAKYSTEQINPKKIIDKLFNYGNTTIPGNDDVGYKQKLHRLVSTMVDEIPGDRQLEYFKLNDDVINCLEEKVKGACEVMV